MVTFLETKCIISRIHGFDAEGNSLTLRVNIKQKTTKETVDGKEVEKPVPGEYTYTVSVRNDSKTKRI